MYAVSIKSLSLHNNTTKFPAKLICDYWGQSFPTLTYIWSFASLFVDNNKIIATLTVFFGKANLQLSQDLAFSHISLHSLCQYFINTASFCSSSSGAISRTSNWKTIVNGCIFTYFFLPLLFLMTLLSCSLWCSLGYCFVWVSFCFWVLV